MRPGEPPAPSRVRIVRPSFYRSEETGRLAPDVRDLLFGLTTITDDEGWMLWRPAEIAAVLYAYTAPGRRMRDLERRAEILTATGLVVIHECGCAELPTLKEHHAVKGGNKNTAVWAWHIRHVIRTNTDMSVSDTSSSSGSLSDSDKGAASESSRAREDAPPAEEAGALCGECRRPRSIHAVTCSLSKHLQAVAS